MDADQRGDLARALADAGYSDVLVVSRDTAEQLLTDRHRELLDHLRHGEAESLNDLADELDRDSAAVAEDLGLLFSHDIIEYERDGASKKPRLKHDHVVVEPLV